MLYDVTLLTNILVLLYFCRLCRIIVNTLHLRYMYVPDVYGVTVIYGHIVTISNSCYSHGLESWKRPRKGICVYAAEYN